MARNPGPEQLAASLALPVARVERMLAIARGPIRLWGLAGALTLQLLSV